MKDFDKAMERIRDEMAKNSQRYVQVVGEYLTEYLQKHPEAAKKLASGKKSISGSLAAMRKEAEKQKEGNVAVLDDAEAFGIVLRYYEAEPLPARAEKETAPDKRRRAEKAAEADPFDLDALMGVM